MKDSYDINGRASIRNTYMEAYKAGSMHSKKNGAWNKEV